MYHMVSDVKGNIEKNFVVAPRRFKEQMEFIVNSGYCPVTLDALMQKIDNPEYALPEKPIIITFDDGYLDNYENAFDILKTLNLPATVFIVADFIGRTNLWDFQKGASLRPLMDWSRLENLNDYGIIIGAHTLSHPFLTQLSAAAAKKEILHSKKRLEDRLGTSVDHFAYPYGDRNDLIKNLVAEAGFKSACSVKPGFNNTHTNPYELRRIEIHATDSIQQFSFKLANGVNQGSPKELFRQVTGKMKHQMAQSKSFLKSLLYR